MVTRASQEVQFGSGQTAVAQPGIGYVTPQNLGVQARVTDGSSRVLDAILGTVGKVAERGFQLGAEDAYLEGAANVGIAKSEAELEGDVFSRDYKVAGFRDTTQKINIAQSEAQLVQDMQWLRERPPEAMQEYLAARRESLTSGIDSMSRQGRSNALQSILTSDQAAISKHQSEYLKFQMETETKAIQARIGPMFRDLQDSLNDPPQTYGLKLANAYSAIKESIWDNPKLANMPALKQSLTKEMFEYALSTDNVSLYEHMRRNQVQFSGEKQGISLFDRLSFDDQQKLSDKFREAKNRTLQFRELEYATMMAGVEAQIDNPDAALPSRQEYVALLRQGVERGVIKDLGAYQNRLENFDKQAVKRLDSTGASLAFSQGNTEFLAARGISSNEAADKYVQQRLRQGGTLQQIVPELWTIGQAHNSSGAYKKLGEFLGEALGPVPADGQMDPQKLALVRDTVTRYNAAEAAAQGGTQNLILSALPEEQRTRLNYIIDLKRNGNLSDLAAWQEADRRILEDSKLPKPARQAMEANAAKVDRTFVDSLTPNGNIAGLIETVGSVLPFNSSAQRKALGAHEGIFESPERAAASLTQAKIALTDELAFVARMSPHLSDEARQRQALANVASRSIPTASGPLVLPRNSVRSQLFPGTSEAVPNEVIGRVLGEVYKPNNPDHRVAWIVDQGRVKAQLFDKSGIFVGTDVVDGSVVASKLKEQDKRDGARFNRVAGEGVVFSKDGAEVRYNGLNTVGVDPHDMFDFRTNLVQNEGVRSKPYDDLSGKLGKDGKVIQTVGVGVSSHNPAYPKPGPDGTITKAQLEESFVKASNTAAQAGADLQTATGLRGKPWFLLFSELAYQSGTDFTNIKMKDGSRPYRELISAAMKGDQASALSALRNSPAWKNSAVSRQEHYKNLIINAMKG